nr:2864_t:CDS:2 [Entrophospora candida]
MEYFNVKKLTFFSRKLTLITLLLCLFLIPIVRAPPPPLSPSAISTSSTVLTFSTISSSRTLISSTIFSSSPISSSHTLISPSPLSPPLFNENVDSSSATNIDESYHILYLIDVFLLVLDIFIFSHLESLYEKRKAAESDFIIILNFLSIILSTLGMIIGCDITTKSILQGLTTMIFWLYPVISVYYDLEFWDYKPTKIEFKKDIIISTAFINFLNAVRLYNNSKDYNSFNIEIFKIIMILISNYDEFLKPILLIIPSTVQGVILYPKYDNIIVLITICLSFATLLMFLHRKVQMSQAWEPQISPKLNEFPKLFFVELETIFLKFCLFSVCFIGAIVYVILCILIYLFFFGYVQMPIQISFIMFGSLPDIYHGIILCAGPYLKFLANSGNYLIMNLGI